MKRVFIDDIHKQGDKTKPGPGRYNHREYVGKQGTSYSVANRLGIDERSLEKSKKLPGPGQYGYSQFFGRNSIQSQVPTMQRFSFARSFDRFKVPTKKESSPAPGVYKPMNNLNENYQSTFKKSLQTKIGMDKSSVIDKHFGVKNSTPGPGAYASFSEF